MRLKRLRREAVLAEPRRAMLASYITALADLAAPKQALRVLEDGPRLRVRLLGARGVGKGTGALVHGSLARDCLLGHTKAILRGRGSNSLSSLPCSIT